MSLARLALRLATYEALNPFATVSTGPWPTIAGPLVWDSRIDLIQADEQIDKLEGKPLLIVYTEEDISTPYGQGTRYPPDEQIVTLVIEAMIATKGQIELKQEDGSSKIVGTLDAPITDRQHETLLDFIEAQVRRVLDTRNRAPSAGLFAKVAMEIHRIESLPQRAVDHVTRVAARTIKLTVKLKKEIWPALEPEVAPTGFDLLPEPLRSVAKGLDPVSSGGHVCADLIGFMTRQVEVAHFAGIVMFTPVGDPSTMNDHLVSTVP